MPLFPQEISETESELGFQHLVIDGLGPTNYQAAAVVRILSASDILVKFNNLGGGISYSHKRWGHLKDKGIEDVEWWGVSDAISESELAIWLQEHDFKDPFLFFVKDVKGCDFTYSECPYLK